MCVGLFHAPKINVTSNVMSFGDKELPLFSHTFKLHNHTAQFFGWQEMLFFAWLGGIFFFLTLFIYRRWKWFQLAKNADIIEKPHIVSLVKEWKAQLKIVRSVVVKFSNHISTPFTMGIFLPKIVLPIRLVECSSVHLESILAHEMAHIKRYDDFWIVLQNLIQIFYFFHPAVWLTNHNLYIARECMCDSLVLAQKKIDRSTYGQGLLYSLKSTFRGFEFAGVLPTFCSPVKVIKIRIQNLKKGHPMKKPLYLKVIFIIAALIVLPMAGKSEQSTQKISSAGVLNSVTENHSISFQNPLPTNSYQITSTYGNRKHPISGEIKFHRAIDLKAQAGTDVYSAADGIVKLAQNSYTPGQGNGKYIDIEHANGFLTRYTQLSDIVVKEGQEVKKGDIIGKVGSSGLSTGPHLHFEIWKDGEHVNPQDYIQF